MEDNKFKIGNYVIIIADKNAPEEVKYWDRECGVIQDFAVWDEKTYQYTILFDLWNTEKQEYEAHYLSANEKYIITEKEYLAQSLEERDDNYFDIMYGGNNSAINSFIELFQTAFSKIDQENSKELCADEYSPLTVDGLIQLYNYRDEFLESGDYEEAKTVNDEIEFHLDMLKSIGKTEIVHEYNRKKKKILI